LDTHQVEKKFPSLPLLSSLSPEEGKTGFMAFGLHNLFVGWQDLYIVHRLFKVMAINHCAITFFCFIVVHAMFWVWVPGLTMQINAVNLMVQQLKAIFIC